MTTSPLHNPDRYMADLRQILSQGRKRIGVLLGAGAPMSIRVNADNQIVQDGRPLVPDVTGLTDVVLDAMPEEHKAVITTLRNEIGDNENIESILTRVRQLGQAIGGSRVHGLDGDEYGRLGQRICEEIGRNVRASLPNEPNPYSELVSWISGTQRTHSVEIFTPNYDLLVEEAFERSQVPYFDGFSGSHKPFFDPASVSSDSLHPRWSLVWKLHGSLGWEIADDAVIRTGRRQASELIYPDHLKYGHITKLPYSALFERFREFLTTPDTLLICSGFSFSDSHICAVMSEALAANAHTAIIAFQYRQIRDEESATQLAFSRPNMSVYARDGAIINGVKGHWRPGETPNEDWQNIRRTFWREDSQETDAEFLLGDFVTLARFLALTQASQIDAPLANQEQDGNTAST